MNEQPREHATEPEQDWRGRLLKSSLALPAGRVRTTKRAAPVRAITGAPETPPLTSSGGPEYHSVKGILHQRLLDELDRRNLLTASEETLTEFVQTFVDEASRRKIYP